MCFKWKLYCLQEFLEAHDYAKFHKTLVYCLISAACPKLETPNLGVVVLYGS